MTVPVYVFAYLVVKNV